MRKERANEPVRVVLPTPEQAVVVRRRQRDRRPRPPEYYYHLMGGGDCLLGGSGGGGMHFTAAIDTALGTAVGNASSLTISGVNAVSGDLIVISLSYESNVNAPSNPTVNGVGSTQDATGNTNQTNLRVYHYAVVGTLTNVNISVTLNNTYHAAMAARKVNGYANFGNNTTAGGTSTTPDSGTVSFTTPSKYIYAAIATGGPVTDAAGTWDNTLAGITPGQRDGTNTGSNDKTISDASQIVNANSSDHAKKTGITSRDWVASVQYYD